MIAAGEMKGVRIRKAIAAVSVIGGFLWLYAALVPPIGLIIAGKREWEDLIFIFMVIPLMAIPAVIAVKYGIALYRDMSLEALKLVLGVFAFFGALVISSRLAALFPDFPARLETGFFLLGILVAVPAYLFAIKRLLHMLGEAKAKTSDVLGKGVLALIAWQVWLVASNLVWEYQSAGLTDEWGLISLFVPILVAYGAYRLSVALLLKPGV